MPRKPGRTRTALYPRKPEKTYDEEAKKLCALNPVCCEYLDLIQSNESIRQKGRFVRSLYSLSLKMTEPLFVQALERALRYGVRSVEGVLSISRNLISGSWWISYMNQHLMAALLDRITENCTVFNMKNCTSIRPKKIVYATQKSPSEEKI